MRFEATPLHGAYVVLIEPREDERGMFARTWCEQEFAEQGLDARLSQCNVSYNRVRGTVRGMHYQAAPHEEAKLVRCTSGAVFDAIIDLRPDSPTYCRWFGVELSAARRNALYVPAGFAHGFQTLTDDAELLYQMSVPYHADSARGVRWNDPAFGIGWPIPMAAVVSPRDASFPDFVR